MSGTSYDPVSQTCKMFCAYFFQSPVFSLRCEGASSSRPVHFLVLRALQTHQPPQKQQVQLPQQVSKKKEINTKDCAPFIAVLPSSLRKCPTPGCDGSGHVTGRFTAHHCISGCPLAERNQGRLKADLSDSECKRNLFFGQRNKKNHYRGRLVCVCVCLLACARLQMFTDLRSSWMPVFRIGRPPKYRKNQQREYQSEFSDNSQYTLLTLSISSHHCNNQWNKNKLLVIHVY